MRATVAAESALRAVPWARPKAVRYIEPIEAAIARLEAALNACKGPIYEAIVAACPRFRPGTADISRSRRMRSDGARNLITLLQGLVASADLRGGYIASPRGDRQWERHVWGVLDVRAYGPRVERERSIARTERHARELAAMGLVSITEITVGTRAGFRAKAAVKRLSDRLWEILGLMAAVRRARRERDRAAGQARVKQLETIAPHPSRKDGLKRVVLQAAPSAAAPSPPPPPPKPPPRPEVPANPPGNAAEMIARLQELLEG